MLFQDYVRIRALSAELCHTLAPEDTAVQTMPDVSPTKWHLAHVTWFFENFVLVSNVPGYEHFDERYHYLFNSYYYTAGPMHARPRRGLLTRPTFDEVLAYRRHVDSAMCALIDKGVVSEVADVITLGLHHEQQHQELMLTDIKHVFSVNPLKPAVFRELPVPAAGNPSELQFERRESGIVQVGTVGDGFCYDNETPRHDALLHPHELTSRLTTNGEFRDFVKDGGYSEPALWLSDGWAAVNSEGWDRPMYWNEDLESEFTLGGTRDIDNNAPVSHVSFYEADAFARWAGARLPTEFEWEHAASPHVVDGNLLESGYLHPKAGSGSQYFGDVWEWTSSSYAPYPGFVPLAGSLGEYNGKFMCNQMTVRGGSCVTSTDHVRASYRSFFYPQQRWQFLGFRLAKDGAQ